MKILGKTLIPLFLAPVILASCNSFLSRPTTSPIDVMETAKSTVRAVVADTQIAIPTATSSAPTTSSALPTPLLFADPSIPMSERVVYYFFVKAAENPTPPGSVMVISYILAPTPSDIISSTDTAANIRTALIAVLNDDRNGWTSSNLEIVDVTFDDGHADVILQGEYYGVGDVTLIAASMQILMTIFTNASVQTATVTHNGDTIGNMGISNSMHAKPANYVFTRAEIETFINEHAYVAP